MDGVSDLFSIVIPLCGGTSCVCSALRDILTRACGSFRLVIVSSNSDSGDLRMIRGIASPHLGMVSRGGSKISTTEGGNVTVTRSR